jgi:hypothetical protein
MLTSSVTPVVLSLFPILSISGAAPLREPV